MALAANSGVAGPQTLTTRPAPATAPRRQGWYKIRPVEGRSCSAALKSEDRRPKPERRPISDFREWPDSIGGCSAGVAINSDLGLRVSFGLRSSGLGFGMARTDFSAALARRRQAGRVVFGQTRPHRPAPPANPWATPAARSASGNSHNPPATRPTDLPGPRS